MEAKSIKKISDAELTEAALTYARGIANQIERKQTVNQNFLDSLNKAYDVQILFMKSGDPELRGVERKIIEAYSSVVGSTDPGDNLQKMGNDSLLYTKPVLLKRPNGNLEFIQALGLRIHKKAVILLIKN